MELSVLAGGDDQGVAARRAALLGAAGADAQAVENIDVALDGGDALVLAATAPSMFGGIRVVAAENIQAITAANLAHLGAAAAGSDAVIVARAGATLAPKVRKALAALGSVVTLSAPRGKGVAMRVDELVAAAGVRPGPAGRRLLVERAGHDLERVASVCRQLSLAGIAEPSAAQLDRLLGSSAAPGVPWALTDALEAGDLDKALELGRSLEPLAVIGYLVSRLAQVGRVVDAGLSDAAAVATALGLEHRFQAEGLLRLARRLGPAQVAAAWDVVAGADVAIKHARDPRVAFELALVDLAGIVAPRR